MVQETIHTVDPNIPVTMVSASRGKRTRAEPISAEYSKGLWHHVGRFDALEEEMLTWVPGNESPNRVDAAVYAGHGLRGNFGEFGITVV